MNIESIELNAGPGFATITPKIVVSNKEVAEVMELLKSGDFLKAHQTLLGIRRVAEDNTEHYNIRMEVVKKTLNSYFNTPRKKCLVQGCNNHTDEGQFVGDLCYPCHTMITTGKITRGGGWIGDVVRWNNKIKEVLRGENE